MTPADPVALAVDLGGTHLRAAIVDRFGQVHGGVRVDTNASAGPDAVLAAIVELAAGVRSRFADLGQGDVAAVGVAAPGPLDPATGVLHAAPNLPGWRNVPLAARVSEALGLPVWLHNDARLAAYGEYKCGAGQGFDPLLFFTLSTGVGAGLIRHGAIEEGAHGLAGELGHTILLADGPRCNFGHPGCLEALVSGTAIARRATALLADGVASRIMEFADADAGDDGRITAVSVAEAALHGDQAALEIYATMGRHLGLAIGSFINAFDPARIVIGGGVARSWPLFDTAMRIAVGEVVMASEVRPIDILPAELGDDAGLVGAGLYALGLAGLGSKFNNGDEEGK